MPVYEYMNQDGERVEIACPMERSIPIGESVRINGETLTRIASLPQVKPDHWQPYISRRLPRNLPGHKCNAVGQPIIETKGQERNAAAALEWERD